MTLGVLEVISLLQAFSSAILLYLIHFMPFALPCITGEYMGTSNLAQTLIVTSPSARMTNNPKGGGKG